MAVSAGPKIIRNGLVYAVDNSSPFSYNPEMSNLFGSQNNATNTFHQNNKPISGTAHGTNATTTEIEPPHLGLTVYKISDDGVDTQNVRYSIKVDASNTWISYDLTYVWSFYVWLPSQFAHRYSGTTSRAIYQNSVGADWHGTRGYNATFDYYGAGSILGASSSFIDLDTSKYDCWQKVSIAFAPLSANVQLPENSGLDNNKWIAGYYRVNVNNAVSNGLPYHLYMSGGQLEQRTFPSRFSAQGRDNTEVLKDWGGRAPTSRVGAVLTNETDQTFSFGTATGYFGTPVTNLATTAVTAECWVKHSSYGQWVHYLDMDWVGDGWLFYSNATNYYFGIAQGGVQYNAAAAHGSTTGWTHIAGTYDGSTVQLYVNGEPTGSTASVSNATLDGTGTFKIGKDGTAAGEVEIGQARVYDRALSAAEIKKQYNATRAIFGV